MNIFRINERLRQIFLHFMLCSACAHSNGDVIELGNLAIDGSLDKKIEIQPFVYASSKNASLYIQHFLTRVGLDGARSQWRFPMLDSYIAKLDSEKFEWARIDGTTLTFTANNNCFNDGQYTWCVTVTENQTVLECEDRRKFIYKKGHLVYASLEDGTELNYLYEGRSGIRVVESLLHGERQIFSRECSAVGGEVGLTVLNHSSKFIYDRQTGLLMSWHALDCSKSMHFRYENNLISTIEINGKLVEHYKWVPTCGGTEYQSLYPFPVYLKGDNNGLYTYKIDNGSILMSERKNGTTLFLNVDTVFGIVKCGGGGRPTVEATYDRITGIIK